MLLDNYDFNLKNDCRVYLCSLDKKILGRINSIETPSITVKGNDISEFNFTSRKTKSNFVYDLIKEKLIIFIEDIGFFKITTQPTKTIDENGETLNISSSSIECELMQYNSIIKVNTGSEDSFENLVEGNVNELGFTKEYIRVFSEDKDFSLLDILLKDALGWSIGYIDPLIKDKIFQFDEENNIYTFLKTSFQKAAKCIVDFDIINLKVNIYRIENYGKYTNIMIGMRTLANSLNITPSEADIYTSFNVSGSNDNGISNVNFGSNIIKNIDYYMKSPWIKTESTINKYNAFKEKVEILRAEYIKCSKEYSSYLEKSEDLYYRTPIDDVEIKWTEYKIEELNESLEYYNTLKIAIENMEQFKTNGVFDIELLKKDVLHYQYLCYIDIIKDITYTINHYNEKEPTPPNDWQTNWILYGISELKIYKELYKEKMDAIDIYKRPWNSLTDKEKEEIGMTEDLYNSNHNLYVEANQNYNSCSNELIKRETEYNTYINNMELINQKRREISEKASISNLEYGFNNEELLAMSKLYNETTYSNQYITTTSLDTTTSSIDVELELFEDAKEKLIEKSVPQYSFEVSLNNLILNKKFENFRDELNLGNFVYVDLDNGQVVKLRVMAITFNPMNLEETINIEFSNMMYTSQGINDYNYILGEELSGQQSSNSSSSNGSSGDSSVSDITNLVKLLLKNSYFNGKLNTIKVETLTATSGEFKTIVASYIQTDEIKAEIAEIIKLETKDLFANYAEIDFANVNTLNVVDGFMQNLMVSQGIIADKIVGGEVVATDVLTGVHIYADDITAGTLSVDRLVIRGSEKSLVYELNNITGALQSKNVDTLNGEILTPRSITTDKIVAHSITSNEINVENLIATGLVEANRIKANNIDVVDLLVTGLVDANKITARNIDVVNLISSGFIGANKITANNIDVVNLISSFIGANQIKANNINAKGLTVNNGEYDTLKIDENGNLSLILNSLSLVVNNKKTKFEDYVKTSIDDITVGVRNLLLKSDFSEQENFEGATFDDNEVTFSNDELGQTIVFSLYGSDFALENIRNKQVTVTLEYRVNEPIVYGDTNPWVGAQLGIIRNETTGGTNQYIACYGNKNFPQQVTNGWIKKSFTCQITDYDTIRVELSLYFRDATGSVSFRNPKVEIGNKPTDYTLAPEDIDESISNATDEIMTACESYIRTTTDGMISGIREEFISTDDFSDFKEIYDAYTINTSDAIENVFEQSKEYIDSVNNETDNKIELIKTYIRDTADGIEIGKSDSNLIAKFSNEELGFYNGTTRLAYYRGTRAYIPDALEVENALVVGNNAKGQWSWEVGENKHFRLRRGN